MLSRDYILILLGVGGVLAIPDENLTVDEAFKKYMIVPTFLPTSPSSELSVRYNNIVVNLGNEISGFITHYPPYISYDAPSTNLYSLVFVDLDRPSGIAPYQSPYLSLLVVNIPGANITAGDFITAYFPPEPYPGSGFHRYLFLVYRQVSRIVFTAPEILRLRNNLANFSLIEFSSRYRLGNPIAGNFLTAELNVCGTGLNDGKKKKCF